jgi:hypothetical protein
LNAVGHSNLLFVTKDQNMLNKSKIALIGAIAAAGMVSNAANAATVQAGAEVDILAPVILDETAILDFGVVAPGALAGTVTIANTADAASCSLGLACVGAASRGAFEGTAANGYTVDITVAASTVLVRAGAPNMNLTLNPSLASFVSTGAVQTFHVGGVLTVGGSQPAGTYTGTYQVDAEYQ